MSEQYAQTTEIIKEELSRIHPEHIVSIAIPGNRSEKIGVKLLTHNYSRVRAGMKGNSMKVSLPEWPAHNHTIVESIQITENGLVFVTVIGKILSQYGTEVIRTIISRMISCGMKDFYAANSEDAAKTKCLVYSLNGYGLNYEFTLMGVANFRVVNGDFAIHTSIGRKGEKNEIRHMSLMAIKKGKYLPSDFICVADNDIAFLGRPNVGAMNPYIPITFKNKTSQRLNLNALIRRKRRSMFLDSSDIQGATVFTTEVSKVIGKIGFNLYGAVQNESLILLPKK